MAGFAGREARAFTWLPELVGAGAIDNEERLNLPTTGALNVTGTNILGTADLVLLVDLKDSSRVLLTTDTPAHEARSAVPADYGIVDLGFNDAQVSSWVHDYGAAHRMDLRVTADSSVALPQLLELVRARLARETGARRARRDTWRTRVTRLHAERRAQWAAVAARYLKGHRTARGRRSPSPSR